jgi:hypothetical protein
MVGCFDRMWNGKLYCHTQGSDIAHMGQCRGTFELGLEGVDRLATEYEKCSLLAHLDFVKSTCSLALAPLPFLR